MRSAVALIALCLVFTLLNLQGITRNKVSPQGLPFTGTWTPVSSLDIVSIQTTLHSENYRMDPTFLRIQTLDQDFWSVVEEHGHLLGNASSSRKVTSTLDYSFYHANRSVSATHICADAPGKGLEGEQGWNLLQKIRVADTDASPRLLCAVYTHARMYPLARAAALTWGRRCNGFVAFTNQTIVALNMLDLRHDGPEAYGNMWQKVKADDDFGVESLMLVWHAVAYPQQYCQCTQTRSIWAYIYQHYLNDYDIYHLGGDDMYVIPENLKRLYANTVASAATKASNGTADTLPPPHFMGQWVPHGPNGMFVGGGGGYTLNRPALRALVEQALPNCHPHTTASFEDRLITKCLRQVGIEPVDTRDLSTAEQTYHDTDPQTLYTTVPVPPDSPGRRRASFHAKAAAYWEGLPHPSLPNTTVGPRTGLDSASAYSVSFHKIHYPDYMIRLHVLLHGHLCPSSTVVGQSLDDSD